MDISEKKKKQGCEGCVCICCQLSDYKGTKNQNKIQPFGKAKVHFDKSMTLKKLL